MTAVLLGAAIAASGCARDRTGADLVRRGPLAALPKDTVGLLVVEVRARAVLDPRGVLREFGVEVAEDTEVRVWDSTSEVRYMVLPERPAGTEGLSEEALAQLVTRDAMIGVARVETPAGGARR